MPAPGKTPAAGTLAAIPALLMWLCAGATEPAFAQDGSAVINGQVKIGDVVANQTLNVVSVDDGVTSQAVAVANTATAVGQNADLSFDSTQRLSGAATSSAGAVVQAGAGTLLQVESSATGNTSTAGTCCGATTGQTTQSVEDGSVIRADAYASTGDLSQQISVDSAAVGNTHGWEAANGSIDATSTQTLNGSVIANTGINACCTAGEGGYSATAAANDVNVDATSSPVQLTTSQTVDGDGVHALVSVTQSGGDTVATQATAIANNVNVSTDGYAASLSDVQINNAAVTAESDLTVGAWNTASSNAYGVGNSAILVNQGYATTIANTQTNNGDVTVSAGLGGGAGYSGTATATAVGNAVSAYACATCDGGVGATNTQVNNGAVRATGTVSIGATGSVVGAASAVGNTATFVVKSSS